MPSQELIEQLKRQEGLGPIRGNRTYVYRCPAGKRTVGYGRNIDANPLSSYAQALAGWDGKSVTLEGASKLLVRDITSVEDGLRDQLPWIFEVLNGPRRDALINMAFQMGIPGLKEFKVTLKCIQNGAYGLAALNMGMSKWAKQTPQRQREIAAQIRTGTYA